jgi:aminoglycoside phosphotransferase (APT) family kinase protein
MPPFIDGCTEKPGEAMPEQVAHISDAIDEPFESALSRLVSRLFSGVTGVSCLARLSGGASQETWSFKACDAKSRRPLILRRAPPGYRATAASPGLVTEARLMELAAGHGVPSPRVLYVLRPEDGLGDGFLMDHVPGETIPRKILRDPIFAEIRPKLTVELGAILARIHAMDSAGLKSLREVSAHSTIAELRACYEADGTPRPVFELAFRWLEKRVASPPEAVTLVHGDFRNGNLIIGPGGVHAVLDWELAHLGDPMEDLGWLCVNSWRFGMIDRPVGGFGPLSELIAGYESAGGRTVDRRRVAFWQTLGSLRWGIMCLGMLARFESGKDRAIERAMIARRASETEIDLLRIIAPCG